MPASARLSQRLLLEAQSQTADGAGGQSITWTALGQHYAAIFPASGSESQIGSAQAQRVTHRVVVRAAPYGGTARPRADQRFRAGDRVLAIRAVFEQDRIGRRLTCLCEETTQAS